MLLGVVVGLPAIAALRRWWHGGSSLDQTAGDLSYGVFLCHVVVIGLLQMRLGAEPHGLAAGVLVCAAATTLAWITFTLVERPMLGLRRSFRVAPSRRVHEVPDAR